VSTAAPRILLLNGPNLNLLGERDPGQYGSTTLADIEQRLTALAKELGAELDARQSNVEGELVTLIQDARRTHDGIILNPGAYAHYSYAIRDAVDAVRIPVVEVHISNVHAREPFRHTSVISPVVAGFICGLGDFGYDLALRAVLRRVAE
jgi:3-dehydroquinate dehydratase-2